MYHTISHTKMIISNIVNKIPSKNCSRTVGTPQLTQTYIFIFYQRISTGTKKDGMAYQLYVDGISILEHTDKPLSLPAPEAIGAAACSPPAYYEDPVPAYEKKTK